MSFEQWLHSRNIDCQTLTPELQAALQSQFAREQQRQTPVANTLVLPADCLWPARGYWVEVAQ